MSTSLMNGTLELSKLIDQSCQLKHEAFSHNGDETNIAVENEKSIALQNRLLHVLSKISILNSRIVMKCSQ